MKSIQQQADEVVEKFRPFAYTKNDLDYSHPSKTYNAVKCAIIHVEGIIDELCKVSSGTKQIIEYTEILTELKSRI